MVIVFISFYNRWSVAEQEEITVDNESNLSNHFKHEKSPISFIYLGIATSRRMCMALTLQPEISELLIQSHFFFCLQMLFFFGIFVFNASFVRFRSILHLLLLA